MRFSLRAESESSLCISQTRYIFLLSNPNINEFTSENQSRALCKAIIEGNTKELNRMCSGFEKHQVNMKHPLGWTPLHVACVNDDMEAVKLLIKHGADPNIQDTFSITSESDWSSAREMAIV